jgi:hypothetical protein
MPGIQFGTQNEGITFRRARKPHATHSVNTFILLIITGLLSTFSTKTVNGQISNELAYDSLILSKSHLFGPGFRFVTGTITPRLERGLRIDTAGANGVEFLPDIKWNPLKGKKMERILEVKMIFSDSLHTEIALMQKDTLQNSQIRLARKTHFRELRGDNPRFVPRILIPAATIVTGVVVIISLFYVRSI